MNRLALMFCAVLAAMGCASAPSDPFTSPPAVAAAWPPPPAKARIVYQTSIASHRDLFREGGFWPRVASVIGGPRDSRLVRPYALAVHPDGALLVADPGVGAVYCYDWRERRVREFGTNLDGGLPSPVGVAVAPGGSVLVSDSRRGRIERFTVGGGYLGPFEPVGTLSRPAGIAVDPANGEVFVADVLAHDIAVFDTEGRLLRRLGRNGSAPGEFNFPTHVALTPDNELLVADSMNFRVQRLDRSGTPIAQYGTAGDARGDFAHPKGVALAGPDVFAAVEGLYDALVFFDGDGQLLTTLGGPGNGPGEFWLPSGLAVDNERHLLFVADSYNARVQVFRLLLGDSKNAPAREESP